MGNTSNFCDCKESNEGYDIKLDFIDDFNSMLCPIKKVSTQKNFTFNSRQQSLSVDDHIKNSAVNTIIKNYREYKRKQKNEENGHNYNVYSNETNKVEENNLRGAKNRVNSSNNKKDSSNDNGSYNKVDKKTKKESIFSSYGNNQSINDKENEKNNFSNSNNISND